MVGHWRDRAGSWWASTEPHGLRDAAAKSVPACCLLRLRNCGFVIFLHTLDHVGAIVLGEHHEASCGSIMSARARYRPTLCASSGPPKTQNISDSGPKL